MAQGLFVAFLAVSVSSWQDLGRRAVPVGAVNHTSPPYNYVQPMCKSAYAAVQCDHASGRYTVCGFNYFHNNY